MYLEHSFCSYPRVLCSPLDAEDINNKLHIHTHIIDNPTINQITIFFLPPNLHIVIFELRKCNFENQHVVGRNNRTIISTYCFCLLFKRLSYINYKTIFSIFYCNMTYKCLLIKLSLYSKETSNVYVNLCPFIHQCLRIVHNYTTKKLWLSVD